jgi:eukaryotic-like serine/threonine-protein kinase
MALPTGTRLGPYEVRARLSVGGMGEVYRATDTNLKRSVAIKVPASMSPRDQHNMKDTFMQIVTGRW